MAKRQRNDHDEKNAFFFNNNGPNSGAAPLPFFPYVQNRNHPFVSNMASCNYAARVYPTSNTGDVNSPLQKRMRVQVDENGQKENQPGGTSKFILLANEVANAVVKRDNIDDTLGHLNKLQLFITSENNDLGCIMKGSPASASGGDLSDAGTLHWMNNFLFLQIGYLSSFQKDTGKAPGSRVTEGPWSKYATSLMKGTVEILAHLQEYNYRRHCTGRKTSPHYQAGFGYGGNTPMTVPSFQLSEVEITECSNVLSKVLRRTLDMIQHSLVKGKDLSDCISTLRHCVDIFCYFQRSMYMCLPALKSDENTVSNLVRVVAEVSGNAKLAKEGGDVLDKIASLFRSLSTRNGFDLEQPPSVLASICSDIIRYCSQSVKATDNAVPSFNVDENHAFFMDFLEKLRFALQSRDDSVQQKWHLLFRSMELMIRTASRNTKLIKSILTCLKYFSMSRHIVPFLSNDKQLVSSIAITVISPCASPKQKDQHKSQSLDLEAMNCITALASKLVSLPTSVFANNGCSNVIDVLFTIAGPKPSSRIQSEVVKGLRLFIRNHTKEIHSALAKMPDPQTTSFLHWMINIPANKKASRSVKQAAITFVLELLFSQDFEFGSKLYAVVLDAAQELMQCEESACEVQIVRILATKVKQRDRLESLANDTSFLSTMLDAATNDKQAPSIRENAMLIIKLVSTKMEIAQKLAGMEDFARCALKFLSFDGNGVCSLYRQYIVETVMQVSGFPQGKKELSANTELTRALLLFARKMREDRNDVVAGDIDKSGPGKEPILSKSRILKIAEDLALMN
jgi:hypothetical protein